MDEPSLKFTFARSKTGAATVSFVDLAGQTHYIQVNQKSDRPRFWIGSAKPMFLRLEQMDELADMLNNVVNFEAVRDPLEPSNPDDFELDGLVDEVWTDRQG